MIVKQWKIGERQGFVSPEEEMEFANLVLKLNIHLDWDAIVKFEQIDVERICSIMRTDVQRSVVLKFLNEDDKYLRNGLFIEYLTLEVLSTPSYCDSLLKLIQFEKIKDNPEIDDWTKTNTRLSDLNFSLLQMASGRRNMVGYVANEKVNENIFLYYLKISAIAKYFDMQVPLDKNRIEEIMENNFEIWQSYSARTLDGLMDLGHDYQYSNEYQEEKKQVFQNYLLKRREIKLPEPKSSKFKTWINKILNTKK